MLTVEGFICAIRNGMYTSQGVSPPCPSNPLYMVLCPTSRFLVLPTPIIILYRERHAHWIYNWNYELLQKGDIRGLPNAKRPIQRTAGGMAEDETDKHCRIIPHSNSQRMNLKLVRRNIFNIYNSLGYPQSQLHPAPPFFRRENQRQRERRVRGEAEELLRTDNNRERGVFEASFAHMTETSCTAILVLLLLL